MARPENSIIFGELLHMKEIDCVTVVVADLYCEPKIGEGLVTKVTLLQSPFVHFANSSVHYKQADFKSKQRILVNEIDDI